MQTKMQNRCNMTSSQFKRVKHLSFIFKQIYIYENKKYRHFILWRFYKVNKKLYEMNTVKPSVFVVFLWHCFFFTNVMVSIYSIWMFERLIESVYLMSILVPQKSLCLYMCNFNYYHRLDKTRILFLTKLLFCWTCIAYLFFCLQSHYFFYSFSQKNTT